MLCPAIPPPILSVHPVPEVSPTDLLENKRNSFSRCNGNSSMIITHYLLIINKLGRLMLIKNMSADNDSLDHRYYSIYAWTAIDLP